MRYLFLLINSFSFHGNQTKLINIIIIDSVAMTTTPVL